MKRTLVLVPVTLLTALASAQITPIGPFTGSEHEGFEGPKVSSAHCMPNRVFNDTADLCTIGANGCSTANNWSFKCQIFSHGGTYFFGSASSFAEFTFDQAIARFGGYMGTINGTPDAMVRFFDANGSLIQSVTANVPADCNWYWNGWEATGGPVIRKIQVISNAFGGAHLDMDDLEYDLSGGACTGNPTVFCTPKVNSAGCAPSISSTGTPSASAGSGFVVTTDNELDDKFGLYLYSKSGASNATFQGGFLCGEPPLIRTQLLHSGGTPPCNGSYTMDFNAYIASGKDPALVAGQGIWLQTWSRDPASPSTTSLSDALSFTICP